MASGWSGVSGVCFSTELEAARATCSSMSNCQGVTGEATDGIGGARVVPVQLVSGASSVYVQPCNRLDSAFFEPVIGAFALGMISILGMRKIWRMFNTHA